MIKFYSVLSLNCTYYIDVKNKMYDMLVNKNMIKVFTFIYENNIF